MKCFVLLLSFIHYGSAMSAPCYKDICEDVFDMQCDEKGCRAVPRLDCRQSVVPCPKTEPEPPSSPRAAHGSCYNLKCETVYVEHCQVVYLEEKRVECSNTTKETCSNIPCDEVVPPPRNRNPKLLGGSRPLDRSREVCSYKCYENGGCQHEFRSPYGESSRGSCVAYGMPLDGPRCLGVHSQCSICLDKCDGLKGKSFSEVPKRHPIEFGLPEPRSLPSEPPLFGTDS